MTATVGALVSFQEGSRLLKELAGTELKKSVLDHRQLPRACCIIDPSRAETGVPVGPLNRARKRSSYTELYMFQKLKPNTLRGRIAEQIRDAILGGALKEGERLVERKLASALGTSLTAVREALIELESEGFILKKTNFGTYVTKMSFEDVQKVFRLRRVLESFAMGEAARHRTAEQVEELEKIYLEMVEAARAKDSRAFNKADMRWHLMVWQMPGNEYLQAALRRGVLPYFAFIAIRITTVDPLRLLRDAYGHLPLLEAIKRGDPEKAEEVFKSTIDDWLAIAQSEFCTGSGADSSGE